MASDVNLPKRPRVTEDEFETYDVFLSHRGPDTKTGFVGFLSDGLKAAGLRPFLDCECIDKGQDSWKCIEHAIKMTPIVVVIFSESFAQSEWCMKELHVMLDTPGIKVLPIFYRVQPWEVSLPESGQLAAGFEKLKQRHDEILIEQWRADLRKASKLNGWEQKVADRRLEKDLVKDVVGKVFELANKPLPLDVGDHVIGVKQVAEKIIQTLKDRKKVLMLGLWGMGGIGKSTLAKELFNQLSKRYAASDRSNYAESMKESMKHVPEDAENTIEDVIRGGVRYIGDVTKKVIEGGTCYVEDVIEKVNQGGVVKVQNRILRDLCFDGSKKIKDKSKGKSILEERLSKKRILLVLDDVRDNDEMDFWITRKMLTEGSLCIVTSRNRRLFEKSNSFDEIYIHDVRLLSSKDSKRVFTSFAFGGDCEVKRGFEKFVEHISMACGGVPLVLKVCGALLKGKSVDIWKEVTKKLNCGTIMDERKIFECLRLSYDALSLEDQEMFLDIACALLGESKDMAIRFWETHGWSPGLGVHSLVEKALIAVDGNGCFKIHDHLRDMGRQIVRKRRESEGVCRRLWMPEPLTLLEKYEVLPDSLQTLVISDIDNPTVYFELSRMKELRILICDHTANVTLLPKQLSCFKSWFNWQGQVCEVQRSYLAVRNIFQSKHLEVLDLSYCSKLYKLPEELGSLKMLSSLCLNYCYDLKELPNSLGQLTRLKQISLIAYQQHFVDDFFGRLRNLCDLNMAFSGIKNLPESFGELYNLEMLNLADSGIEILPEFFGELYNLKVLNLSKCHQLYTLPNSFGQLRSLKDLDLRDSRNIGSLPSSFGELSSLEVLNLWHSDNISELPDSFGSLINLIHLTLYGSGLKCLPESFGQLSNLRYLDLSFCMSLNALPRSFIQLTSLEKLNLRACPVSHGFYSSIAWPL